MTSHYNRSARLYIIFVAVSLIGMHVLLLMNLPELFKTLF